MGAYTRAAVDHYIGSYLTLRTSFSRPECIVAYRTDVTWDPDWPSLLFQERDRLDAPYSHRGRLYIPASSMFIHLVSLTKGAMRMIVVSQVDRFGEMRGIVTTIHKHGAMLVPVATPIVYVKRETFDGSLGDITAANPLVRVIQEGARGDDERRLRAPHRALSASRRLRGVLCLSLLCRFGADGRRVDRWHGLRNDRRLGKVHADPAPDARAVTCATRRSRQARGARRR